MLKKVGSRIIRGVSKLPWTPQLSKTKKCISGKKIVVHVNWLGHLDYKKTKKMYKWEKNRKENVKKMGPKIKKKVYVGKKS